MDVSKEDKLKALLTPAEYTQIESFPTILRLLNIGELTTELLEKFNSAAAGKGREALDKLLEIKIHRVIDNKEVTLTKEELFIAFNFQIMHQLDFLPCSNWSSEIADPMFQVFFELYELLTTTQLLDAGVQVSMEEVKNLSEKDEFGMPVTLPGIITRNVPKWLKRQQLKTMVMNYSKKIGHDLSYTITWAE